MTEIYLSNLSEFLERVKALFQWKRVTEALAHLAEGGESRRVGYPLLQIWPYFEQAT